MEDCYEKMSNAVPEASVASANPCIGKRTRKASARRTKGDRTTGTEYTIHEEYCGDGWGKATPECVQQIYELAQTEGIYVEQVYTSKTLYGMLDMVRKELVDGSACWEPNIYNHHNQVVGRKEIDFSLLPDMREQECV